MLWISGWFGGIATCLTVMFVLRIQARRAHPRPKEE